MSILEQLYYGNLTDSFHQASEEYKKLYDKEMLAYEKLVNVLNDEQKELFENFLTTIHSSSSCEKKDAYIIGFKTGLQIGIECK